MSHSLCKLLKGVGAHCTVGVMKGDTRSLDNTSYGKIRGYARFEI